MKGLCLAGFLSLAVMMSGCGTTHSMVKHSSNSSRDPQMKAFYGLGEVEQTAKGIQITLSADTIFKIHSSRLSHDGMASVDAVAGAILKYPNDQVRVMGYTDNSGTDIKNTRFSLHRADAVKKELVKQGVLAANVSARGEGPAEPVAPNDTEDNKMKNRRIVFLISSPDTAAEK